MGMRVIGIPEAIKTVEGDIETRFRQALLAFYQAVISQTPVDTGHARANWFMDFGSFIARIEGSNDSPGNAGPDSDKALTWRTSDSRVFVHNSVEYVIYLDAGSSAQAPQGILDPTLAATRDLF